MKKKQHRFEIIVTTHCKRELAELDLLYCFAQRQPDKSEFRLLKKRPKK